MTVTDIGGFWIRIWMKYGRSRTNIYEDYRYLKYQQGYLEADESTLKMLAESWAEHEMRGYTKDSYSYGYEIVIKPPMEWMNKELEHIKKKRDALAEQELLLKMFGATER